MHQVSDLYANSSLHHGVQDPSFVLEAVGQSEIRVFERQKRAENDFKAASKVRKNRNSKQRWQMRAKENLSKGVLNQTGPSTRDLQAEQLSICWYKIKQQTANMTRLQRKGRNTKPQKTDKTIFLDQFFTLLYYLCGPDHF